MLKNAEQSSGREVLKYKTQRFAGRRRCLPDSVPVSTPPGRTLCSPPSRPEIIQKNKFPNDFNTSSSIDIITENERAQTEKYAKDKASQNKMC
jgi:hypothetical protein